MNGRGERSAVDEDSPRGVFEQVVFPKVDGLHGGIIGHDGQNDV